MPAYPGFIGGTEKAQAAISSCARSVNLYTERRTQTARPGLYSWPGQTKFSQTTAVNGRALFEMNGRCLGVMGADVGEIDVNGTWTRYGGVVPNAARAQIAMNGQSGNQALVCSGGFAYVLNLTTNVLSAAVAGLTAHQIGFLDGYGIAFDRTLSRFRLSNLNDFTVWDPTQFQGRSQAPDNWLAMIVHQPDIWLIGAQTGEVWFDAGAFPFPFQPRPGATFPWGIAAADSLAVVGDSVLWVSRNREGQGIVVRARGYSPSPYSDPALEAALARYAAQFRIDDAEGIGLQWQGHAFYVLNFPSVPATWFVDLATGEWMELGAWNPARGDFDAWRARVHCQAFGKHLVAQAGSSIVSFLDIDSSTEQDGSVMRRLRVPPSLVSQDGRPVVVDALRLQIQTGVGTQTGAGVDPVALLRVSSDFGLTYGNEIAASIGRIGATHTEVLYTRLGSGLPGWVPSIVISDPVPVQIVGVDILGDNLGIQSAGA